MDEVRVVDNPERRRFEARRGRRVIGWTSYDQTAHVIVFHHTEVRRSEEGHGIGSRLVQATLDHVRAQGMKVVSECPFVTEWMHRNPEYLDLLQR